MPSRRAGAARLLPLIDIVLINLAFLISYLVRYRLEFPYPVLPQYDAPFWPYLPYAALLTLLCLLTYRIDGLYEFSRTRRWFEELYRIGSGTTIAILVVMAITFALQPLVYSRGMLILAALLIVILLGLARLIDQAVRVLRHRQGKGVDRVLVIGMGELGRSVARGIMVDPLLGYLLVGYIDDDPEKAAGRLGRIPGLGRVDDLGRVISEQHIDEVIVTLPSAYHRRILQIIEDCESENVRVRVVPDVFQQRMTRLDVDTLNGIPLIGPREDRLSHEAVLLKRAIDLVVASLALPFIALIALILLVAIRLDDGGPLFFRHRRVGRDGREFDLYKFRSMVVGAEQLLEGLKQHNETGGPTFKMTDDPRVTRVGRFIRAASIDELPQFLNVLRGEMSVVGPRPGTPDEVARYEPWQRKRLSVQPGITGMWQVNGRSDVPFEEMVLLDIFYIENWSLDLDLRLMLRTVPYVFFGKGAK